MFTKRNIPQNFTPQKSEVSLTCLSEGSVLVGDFMTKSNVRIECDVRGKVVTSGRLVISEQARIDGNVKCGEALVMGLVKGNIVSSGEVSLKMPAKVLGNILAAVIHIEKGVVISGMYKILEKEGNEQVKESNEPVKQE